MLKKTALRLYVSEVEKTERPLQVPLQVPVQTVAYLGDGVYELFIREYLIEKGIHQSNKLHKKATDFVKASFQAELLVFIQENKDINLTEEEQDWIRRGRNISGSSGSKAKKNDQQAYRQATAFETLIGYLYMTNKNRLTELCHAIKEQLV